MPDNSKIAFITCVNDEEQYNECLLYLRHLKLPGSMMAEYFPLYGEPSMAAGYNKAMGMSDARYKVYLHQDTLVVNKTLVPDALQIFEEATIGLIGMVGCRSLPASGRWWDGLRCYGRVLHACEPESVVDSEMQEPSESYIDVQAADGLFLMTQYDIPWRDDLFKGWHFYDASQCMEFARRGYKTVVPNQVKDFWCIHCPREKPLAPDYKVWQKIFLNEYSAELSPEI